MVGNPGCLEAISGIPFEFLVNFLKVDPLSSCSTDVQPSSKFSMALDLLIIEGSRLGTSTGRPFIPGCFFECCKMGEILIFEPLFLLCGE